jgi:hypothetical protein
MQTLDIDELVALLRDGMCPVCGEGPYKMVLQHIRMRHGLNADEFRKRFGLNRTAHFVAPDTHTKLSACAVERGYVLNLTEPARQYRAELADGVRKKPRYRAQAIANLVRGQKSEEALEVRHSRPLEFYSRIGKMQNKKTLEQRAHVSRKMKEYWSRKKREVGRADA